ncbi:MAG: MucR family transcriptional regulator [Alphaproteobacteria bacterium]|nr:MucR family transcriptional regulator [Alphaproteobacteria bacterium]
MTKNAGETAVTPDEILRMTADVVAAYLGNNTMPATQIPEVISTVYGSLCKLDGTAANGRSRPPKAPVPIRRSVTPDYIVCLEDGKKLKMLKRHLRTVYGMTPEEYRAKWGLPSDYPMVAPNYSRQRSAFAKKIGLGRSSGRSRRKNAA